MSFNVRWSGYEKATTYVKILLAQVDWIVGGEGHKAEKTPCSNPPHTCPFLHLSNQNAVHSVVSGSVVRNSSG